MRRCQKRLLPNALICVTIPATQKWHLYAGTAQVCNIPEACMQSSTLAYVVPATTWPQRCDMHHCINNKQQAEVHHGTVGLVSRARSSPVMEVSCYTGSLQHSEKKQVKFCRVLYVVSE